MPWTCRTLVSWEGGLRRPSAQWCGWRRDLMDGRLIRLFVGGDLSAERERRSISSASHLEVAGASAQGLLHESVGRQGRATRSPVAAASFLIIDGHFDVSRISEPENPDPIRCIQVRTDWRTQPVPACRGVVPPCAASACPAVSFRDEFRAADTLSVEWAAVPALPVCVVRCEAPGASEETHGTA